MQKLIAIVGLTSSGKSELGIRLAEHFSGEIVSADSRQVYKGLDYCSGKVSDIEQKRVKHHLLDVAEIGSQFTLFDFQTLAYRAIDDIIARGKVPFLVGGTGLYSRAVVCGYDLVKERPDEDERKNLNELSLERLVELCQKYKIEVGAQPTKRRLIRLIETKDAQPRQNKPRYDVLQIGIKFEREEIYKRIKTRLEARMPNMIEEIKNLLASGASAEFLRGLGLEAKCVVDYLSGVYKSYEEFFEELYKQERHFAKRQQTWYNKEDNIVWLNAGNGKSFDELFENAVKLVSDFLNKH